MTSLFVADDEPFSLRRLLFVLKELPDVRIVGQAANGKAALSEIERLRPDLAILDIEMPGLNGLELASALGDTGPRVIFVTAFAQHAPEAFAVEAVDYVLKPFKRERLLQAIDRARKRVGADHQSGWSEKQSSGRANHEVASSLQSPALTITSKGGSIELPQSEILWIEAEKDYVLIHTHPRTHIQRSTMTEISRVLAPWMMRVHRSAFVSVDAVHHSIRSPKGLLTLVLIDGTEVPVGPSYTQSVRDIFSSIP